MAKRGQVTIFVILGIIILATLFLLSSNMEKPGVSSLPDSKPIKSFTESCIKSTLEQGLVDVGYANLQTLEDYMNNNIKNCTNSFIDFQGIDIREEDIISDISLSQDNKTLIVNVKYPITIQKQDSTSKLENFYLSYVLISQTALNNMNGITTSETTINSKDMGAKLVIPQGVNVAYANGTTIDSISIIMADSIYTNKDVFGHLIYDLQPSGIQFDPSAKLTVRYDNDIIYGTNISESKLHLQYFNDATSSWISLPTERDIDNNTLKANITHFTYYGIGVPYEMAFNVTNPVNIIRENEIVTHKISLEDSILHEDNIGLFILFNDNNTLVSDYVPGSIELYNSGFIKSFAVIFQDSFSPDETKSYKIKLNYESNMEETSFYLTGNLNSNKSIITLNNGIRDYEIGHNFYQDTVVQALYIKSKPVTINPLSWIFGNSNQPCNEECPQFVLSYGIPISVNITENNLFLLLDLKYGALVSQMNQADQATDLIDASVRIIFFKNNEKVVTYTNQNVKGEFSNHNGFLAGEISTDIDKPGIFFGTSPKRDIVIPRMAVPVYLDLRSSPDFFTTRDADGHGPANLFLSDNSFDNFYVVENSNKQGTFIYIPDYKKYVYPQTYEDTEGDIFPSSSIWIERTSSAISAAIFNVYTSTGLGTGWFTMPVGRGEHKNEITFIPGLNFNSRTIANGNSLEIVPNTEEIKIYYQQLDILKNPMYDVLYFTPEKWEERPELIISVPG